MSVHGTLPPPLADFASLCWLSDINTATQLVGTNIPTHGFWEDKPRPSERLSRTACPTAHPAADHIRVTTSALQQVCHIIIYIRVLLKDPVGSAGSNEQLCRLRQAVVMQTAGSIQPR